MKAPHFINTLRPFHCNTGSVCFQLFSGVFVDDPSFLSEVALSLVEKQEQQDARKTKKERQALSVKTVGQVMELVTLRHRLLESAWETEVLADVSITQHEFTFNSLS